MTYRFIGAESKRSGEVPLRLDRLGQRFQAEPEEVNVPGGIPALSEEDFATCFEGIPEEMLTLYAEASVRKEVPPELDKALKAAGARLHQLRSGQATSEEKRAVPKLGKPQAKGGQ